MEGRSLAEKKVSLKPECEALVLLSEPEDAFKSYESSMVIISVQQNVKFLEKALKLPVRYAPTLALSELSSRFSLDAMFRQSESNRFLFSSGI